MCDLSQRLHDESEAKGKFEEKIATAKHMLSLGKSIQDIELITNLPLTAIKQIQTEMLRSV